LLNPNDRNKVNEFYNRSEATEKLNDCEKDSVEHFLGWLNTNCSKSKTGAQVKLNWGTSTLVTTMGPHTYAKGLGWSMKHYNNVMRIPLNTKRLIFMFHNSGSTCDPPQHTPKALIAAMQQPNFAVLADDHFYPLPLKIFDNSVHVLNSLLDKISQKIIDCIRRPLPVIVSGSSETKRLILQV